MSSLRQVVSHLPPQYPHEARAHARLRLGEVGIEGGEVGHVGGVECRCALGHISYVTRHAPSIHQNNGKPFLVDGECLHFLCKAIGSRLPAAWNDEDGRTEEQVIAKLVDFGIAMVLLFGLMVYFRVVPSISILMLPALVLLMMPLLMATKVLIRLGT